MIAADRAMSILAPMANANTQRKRIKFMIFFTWIISFLFAVPAVSKLLIDKLQGKFYLLEHFSIVFYFHSTHFKCQNIIVGIQTLLLTNVKFIYK